MTVLLPPEPIRSVDAYLAKEAGVTAVDLAALKAAYLE